jgi:hypothetical protein
LSTVFQRPLTDDRDKLSHRRGISGAL